MTTVLVQKHSVTRKKVRNQAQKIGHLCKEKKGEFVVFTYEDEPFPGQIIIVKENDTYLKPMVKTLKSWKWSEIQEDNFYE